MSSRKRQKPWNNRAHLSPSKDNSNQCIHFKQFFDKPSNSVQNRDHLKYICRTEFDGIKNYQDYKEKVKEYWERRSPLKKAEELHLFQQKELNFINNFHVMHSRDNEINPRGEREYFDKPVFQDNSQFMHKRTQATPLILNKSNFSPSKTTLSLFTDQRSIRKMSQTMQSFFSPKSKDFQPITTGISDHKLFENQSRATRDLAKKGGESSLKYGIIPFLREDKVPSEKKIPNCAMKQTLNYLVFDQTIKSRDWNSALRKEECNSPLIKTWEHKTFGSNSPTDQFERVSKQNKNICSIPDHDF